MRSALIGVFVYYPTRNLGSNAVYMTVSKSAQPLVLSRIELVVEPTSIQVNEAVTFLMYSNTVEIKVEAPTLQLATIQLTASSTSIEKGESVTFTVKCHDQYGNPMNGVIVALNIGGETITIGPTDETGIATYTRPSLKRGRIKSKHRLKESPQSHTQ